MSDIKLDPQKAWVPVTILGALIIATATGVSYFWSLKGTADAANDRSIKVETRQDAQEERMQIISESQIRVETKLDIVLGTKPITKMK